MKVNETNVSMIIKINSYDMWSMGDIDKVSHNICKTNTLLRIFMYKTPSCNCSFSCGLEKEKKLLNMNTYFYTWSIKGFTLWCKLSITNLNRCKMIIEEILMKNISLKLLAYNLWVINWHWHWIYARVHNIKQRILSFNIIFVFNGIL